MSQVIKLEKSYLNNNKELCFENETGFLQAINKGFFLLAIPKDIDLKPAIKFAKSFYLEGNDKFHGYKKYDGIYFDREYFQTEHVLLDQNDRIKYFDDSLLNTCNKMYDLAINILKNIFLKLSIPETEWDKITAGITTNQGINWFACSHYRPHLDLPGCAEHKDTGFITVLYIEQSGLQAYIDHYWYDIEPEKGYFIINFGAAMEILTKNLAHPIMAILHRVKKMNQNFFSEDRFSFASFLNPGSDKFLYQFDHTRSPLQYLSVKNFLDDFNKNTWQDKHDEFGIK